MRFPVRSSLVVVLLFVLLLSFPSASAQVDPLNQVGNPTFNTAWPVGLGATDVANGNLHQQIPLGSFPQRGGRTLTAGLTYDSRIWKTVFNGTSSSWQPTNVPSSQGGWRFISGGQSRTVTYLTSDAKNFCGGHSVPLYISFAWTSPDGTIRNFMYAETVSDPNHFCGAGLTSSSDASADDSSGYHIYVTNSTQAVVYAPNGTQVYPAVKDTNGNYLSLDPNGNVIDTLGRRVA